MEEDLEIAEKVMEEEVKELQDVAEEGKRVKLPIDMLLGNPALVSDPLSREFRNLVQDLSAMS